MAKINDTTTYPVTTPTTDDTLIGTNTTDGKTKNFTIASILALGGGAGVTDGDKGDVVVSGSGATWTVDALPESRITNLVSDLALKAPLASPTFTGTPAAPTAAPGTNTTQLATTAFVVAAAAAATVADGDKGDIVVSGSGAVWTLDTAVVTAAAKTVLDDATVGAMLTTLGAPGLASPNVFTAHNAFGANAAVDNVDLFYPGLIVQSVLSIQETVTTDISGMSWFSGIQSFINADHATNAASTALYGADIEVQSSPTNTKTLAGLRGIYGSVWHRGSGAIESIYGLQYYAYNDQANFGGVTGAYIEADSFGGTGTDIKGVDVYASNAGTVTNLDGLHIRSLDNSGTATNVHGLRIGNQSQGSSNWAIKTGTGAISFGDTVTATDIAVSGTKTAHYGLFGPAAGSPAAPTWRALVAADIPSLSGTYQPVNSNLTTIAGLTATTDNFIVSVASAWASRTPAQVRTTLSLSSVENTALSTWAGSTTITTLGTVVTGTWSATLIAAAKGGTGIANGASATLTLPNAATTITGGGTLALGGFTFTVPATGTAALLGTANVFTAAQTDQRDAIGASTTDGLILTNATAAAAGAQQWSPRLHFTGQGWKTNTTAASQTVDWITELVPVQAAAAPSSKLVFSSQVNGGGYTQQVAFDQGQNSAGTGPVINIGTTANNGIGLGGGNQGTVSVYASATEITRFTNSNGILLGATLALRWGIPSGTLALKQNASAALEVNNGTAGQWQAITAGVRDAATNTIVDGLTLGHQTSGTQTNNAAGLGIGVLLNINSTTTSDQNAFRLTTELVVATHASYTTRAKLNVYGFGGAHEALRLEDSGSAAMFGVLGAAAVVRQTGGENLTNNVTSGGTTGQIDDFAGSLYATDAAAIRNNIYQLARLVKQDHDALRLYGFLT